MPWYSGDFSRWIQGVSLRPAPCPATHVPRYLKMFGLLGRGHVPALTGHAERAIELLTSETNGIRSAGGATVTFPFNLSLLARAHAHAGDFDGAWRCIDEAMTLVERTKERWFEVEVHRIAGEIMLKSPEKGRAKAQTFLSARLQLRVHSRPSPWELRAAMSMARLWRDQGKRRGPRASRSVYGWFLKTSTRAI
jgi:predicted ATPase